jgi:hypothetical protein
LAAFLGTLAALAYQTLATSVVPLEFESLCRKADAIAYVKCAGVRSFVASDGQQVMTETRLEVLAPVKGTPGAEVTLILPGGKAEGRRTEIPGIPRFIAGEEAVVFLTRAGVHGSPWPVGLQQGCYVVRAGKEGDRWVALAPGANPVPRDILAKPTGTGVARLPLDAFLDRIQRELAAPSGERPQTF